ncbi:Flp/Fap pilin component [Burkholderia sp. lig30]|jgi:pilus assembly protein Flp/PilA|uniref:pilus assembly protein n=1 Tax=Burkholderia sp. lig30 TaxID=1192124 RepID=UPI000461EDB5|nr:pilus assembly protein [Burkholderia sp. lig30]KDB08360.1 Flp/Fap pilin component [Burkholderia sp. lig30]
MIRFILSLSRDERGVSALEYSVLAGIVVVAVAAAGAIFGADTGLPGLFKSMIDKVTNVQTNGH